MLSDVEDGAAGTRGATGGGDESVPPVDDSDARTVALDRSLDKASTGGGNMSPAAAKMVRCLGRT
jgi:hypothetical protein